MKTFLCYFLVSGAVFAQSLDLTPPGSLEPSPPVIVTAARQSMVSVAALYRLTTGRTLITAADIQDRQVAIGPFEAPAEEARAILLEALTLQGFTVRKMTPQVDMLVATAMLPPVEVTESPLPRVSGPNEPPFVGAVAGVREVHSEKEELGNRVVALAAEIGALTLGHRYESGVDFLAALDDFKASNSPAGIVAGHGVSGGFRDFQLASAAQPLSAYLKLLDADSDYNSLARPRMQVLEGQTGRISTGQKVAVPTQTLTTLQGGPSTSSNIRYQDVELALEITPEVRDDGRIVLRITQSDNSIAGTQIISGNTIPTIASQTFSTVTIVRPLETIALGGIKIERERKSAKGPRGLAKVPLLGRLFRVDASTVERSELVLFITAWLVE